MSDRFGLYLNGRTFTDQQSDRKSQTVESAYYIMDCQTGSQTIWKIGKDNRIFPVCIQQGSIYNKSDPVVYRNYDR